VNRVLRYLVLAGSCLGAAAPAHAGLLDFLFGRPAPAYYEPSPYAGGGYQTSPENSAADAAARKADQAAKRAAMERRTAEQAAHNKEMVLRLKEVAATEGPKAAFMQDPTLRAGDVVVTPSGIEVFQGSRGQTHKAAQFLPLGNSRLARRADLVLLQKVSGLNAPENATAGGEIRPLTISPAKKPPAHTARRHSRSHPAKPKIARAGDPNAWASSQP
jgi:hypothetical protein